MGIKIKGKTSPVKNVLLFFYKYMEFNFFQIFLTFLSQNYTSHHCKDKPMGSSTETVAFQVYEILKMDHEFLQFF